MSRRLRTTTFSLIAFMVVMIALAFVALALDIPALSIVVLVLAALAVVAFNYMVVNPALLESAKKSARNYCEAGEIIDPGLHDKLCGRLSKAPKDAEAAELHKKLIDLRENAGNAGPQNPRD